MTLTQLGKPRYPGQVIQPRQTQLFGISDQLIQIYA